jgi:hypothetical protein
VLDGMSEPLKRWVRSCVLGLRWNITLRLGAKRIDRI